MLPLIFACVPLSAQQGDPAQDPEAEAVIGRSAAAFSRAVTLTADFEMAVQDRKAGSSGTGRGSIVIKQGKYRVTTSGNTVYYDGKTMWTYYTDANEVVITEPDPDGGDFLTNPASVFTFYKRDFKYRYIGNAVRNGISFEEVDLYPKDLNQPYSRIKVFFSTASGLPETITSFGKDGVDYTVSLRNVVTNKEVADAYFTFDPSQYKKVDVIDMRGLK